MSNTLENAETYLNLIATKLEIPLTDVYDIVVNFQYSYGLNLIGLVLVIWLLYIANRKLKLGDESHISEHVAFNVILGLIISLGVAMFIDILSHLIYPEYYAIQNILNSILTVPN